MLSGDYKIVDEHDIEGIADWIFHCIAERTNIKETELGYSWNMDIEEEEEYKANVRNFIEVIKEAL